MSPQAKNPVPEQETDPRADAAIRHQAARAYISILFDEAFELSEQHERLVASRKQNRDSLRQNIRFMDEEQRKLLEELYAERSVTRRTPEQRAAYLQEQADAAKKAAAEKAAEAAKNGPKAE